jgi:hypothetical protein
MNNLGAVPRVRDVPLTRPSIGTAWGIVLLGPDVVDVNLDGVSWYAFDSTAIFTSYFGINL